MNPFSEIQEVDNSGFFYRWLPSWQIYRFAFPDKYDMFCLFFLLTKEFMT